MEPVTAYIPLLVGIIFFMLFIFHANFYAFLRGADRPDNIMLLLVATGTLDLISNGNMRFFFVLCFCQQKVGM